MDDENSASGEACMKMEDHSIDLTASKRKRIDHVRDDDDDSEEEEYDDSEEEEEDDDSEDEEEEEEELFYDDKLWRVHWRWHPNHSKTPFPVNTCTEQVRRYLLNGKPPERSCPRCKGAKIDGEERCDFSGVHCDYFVVELLGIRVQLPEKGCTVALHDGDHSHLLYDGQVPRVSVSACQGPRLEDYDLSVLLLDGPSIPVKLGYGAILYAGFRPRLGRMCPAIGSSPIYDKFGDSPVIVHQVLHSKDGEEMGFIDVGFIPIAMAVTTRVDIILRQANSTIPSNGVVDLFGMITARYDICEGDALVFDAQTFEDLKRPGLPKRSASSDPCLLSPLLFQKKIGEAVSTSLGEKIGLSRSILCVPRHSSVVVKVQLFCALQQGTESTSYKSFVKGDAKFYPPRCGGTSTAFISSEHGQVEVTLSWNFNRWSKTFCRWARLPWGVTSV